jgi:hypothetical protein
MVSYAEVAWSVSSWIFAVGRAISLDRVPGVRRIHVAPMSAAWLREHEAWDGKQARDDA